MATRPSITEAGRSFAGGSAADLGAAATELLQSLRTKPRLLGLGEAMHGEEELLQVRNQLFRQLVEHEGYRSIAIESSCLAGLLVDEFVVRGAGTLEEAMRHGFSHGFGASQANRDLVQWLRQHNENRPETERVRFFGFDAPMEMTGAESPKRGLIALHDYLCALVDSDLLPCDEHTLVQLLGADERWTNPAAAMDPSRSVGAAEYVTTLRLLADDLIALLVAQAPHLISATSRDDWWEACLYGRTAAGLLRYHASMADTSEVRVARLMGLRDGMMADNLNAILENQAHRGPTLAFAHNRHLQREKSLMRLGDLALQWWSAGAIVAAQRGEEYAFIASALGAAPHQGLDIPHPDTVEGALHALPENRYLFNSERLAVALRGTGSTFATRTDNSSNYTYFALDPAYLGDTDGVAFIKHIDLEPQSPADQEASSEMTD